MEEARARSLDAVIGANVRARRKGLDLRQPDLAETMVTIFGETAWSASTVSRVEDGKRSIRVSELVSLACALGSTPEELLDPVAFDESPIEMPGGTIDAHRLRAILRGEVRVRVSLEGPTEARKVNTRFSPTERGGSVKLLAFGLEGGEELLRKMEEGKR